MNMRSPSILPLFDNLENMTINPSDIRINEDDESISESVVSETDNLINNNDMENLKL